MCSGSDFFRISGGKYCWSTGQFSRNFGALAIFTLLLFCLFSKFFELRESLILVNIILSFKEKTVFIPEFLGF